MEPTRLRDLQSSRAWRGGKLGPVGSRDLIRTLVATCCYQIGFEYRATIRSASYQGLSLPRLAVWTSSPRQAGLSRAGVYGHQCVPPWEWRPNRQRVGTR